MIIQSISQQVESVNATLSPSSNLPAQQEDGTAQEGANQPVNSNSEATPEHCSNLCPEQQVEIFMRLDMFASVYLVKDLTGLLEQLKAK